MSRIRHFLFIAALVAAVVFLASVNGAAQGGISYEFLEVIDYAGKPVADAMVETFGCNYAKASTTNQKGQLERGLPICYGDFQTRNFTISKPGYYTFEDIGLLSSPFSNVYGRKYVDKLIIELLKIPETASEQKILGSEHLKREMFLAVKYGRTDEVRQLLKDGVSPNLNTNDLRGVPGPKDVPAIVYAAAFADVETVKAFLDAGADIRSKNSNARDILLYYLDADPTQARYWYLNRKRNATDAQEADPARRFEEGFDMLLKAGADREIAVGEEQLTPLKKAVWKGYVRIVKKLLDAGVSAQAKNEALLYLIRFKDERDPLSAELANLLIKAGADPDYAGVIREHPDDNYCQTPLMTAGNAEKLDFVRMLLANKADVNFACQNGKTALIAAILEQRTETAKLLLDAGANGNGKGYGSLGKTALMIAAEKGYTEIVETLIARGAEVNARDKMVETALDLALWNNARGEMVELLLRAGTDPNGQTAPYCVVPLTFAAARGNVDAIRLLIEYKANVNPTCGNGDAPVAAAARNNQTEAVKILLDAGADAKGEQGRRALKYARENLQNDNFKSKAEEIIKLLEAAGAK